MGYADVQKLHDFKSLRNSSVGAGRDEVLRTVLAIALDPEMASWCLGCVNDAPIMRWPSSLYRVLSRAAFQSPRVWRRCALLLDRTLHEALLPYEGRSAADLVELFLDGRGSLSGDELAALLWCLLRERCHAHDLLAERLGLELQVVAAQRLRATRSS